MSTSATSNEIKNELKATLTARRDLGPEYDDAFVDAFMDKLGERVARELHQRHELRPVSPPARPAWALTIEGRLTIALASMFVILALFIVGMLDASVYYGVHAVMYWAVLLAVIIFLANLALNVRLHLKVKR